MRRAVDGDERARVRPLALWIASRVDLLARAGLAGEQHLLPASASLRSLRHSIANAGLMVGTGPSGAPARPGSPPARSAVAIRKITTWPPTKMSAPSRSRTVDCTGSPSTMVPLVLERSVSSNAPSRRAARSRGAGPRPSGRSAPARLAGLVCVAAYVRPPASLKRSRRAAAAAAPARGCHRRPAAAARATARLWAYAAAPKSRSRWGWLPRSPRWRV